MNEAKMQEFLNEWVKGTSVPVAFTGSTNDIREGARSFAAFLTDKVVPVEPPKE